MIKFRNKTKSAYVLTAVTVVLAIVTVILAGQCVKVLAKENAGIFFKEKQIENQMQGAKTVEKVVANTTATVQAATLPEEETQEEYTEDFEDEEGYVGDDVTDQMSQAYGLSGGIYGFSSRDAYILACIVSAEAGDQDYDCQLAVANVVIHRAFNLGGQPGAIEEAVYQPYQFEPAYTTMQDFIANGPNEDAIAASQDALSGIDNVPGYEHFCYYTIMDDYLDCEGGIQIGSEWFYY